MRTCCTSAVARRLVNVVSLGSTFAAAFNGKTVTGAWTLVWESTGAGTLYGWGLQVALRAELTSQSSGPLTRLPDEPAAGGLLDRLLRQARAALPAGGVLLIAEAMAGVRGAETVGDAYFSFYLMAMGKGRARRAEELHEMLRVAGFRRSREVGTRFPIQTGLIVAEV